MQYEYRKMCHCEEGEFFTSPDEAILPIEAQPSTSSRPPFTVILSEAKDLYAGCVIVQDVSLCRMCHCEEGKLFHKSRRSHLHRHPERSEGSIRRMCHCEKGEFSTSPDEAILPIEAIPIYQ
jgi:hypothetical protein